MKRRRPLTITSRASSIANAFVQAIVPTVEASPTELAEALNVLGMTRDTMCCVYCGAAATDWDHLRPLVKDERPTGYVTEIRNLVPSCGPCNQSKGGREWREWIQGRAKGSPKARGVADLALRIERLAAYEKWGADLRPLTLGGLVPQALWDRHWQNLKDIKAKMQEAQRHADQLREAIRAALMGQPTSRAEADSAGPEST